VKEPPYDDELLAAMALLICVLIITLGLCWVMYLNRDLADFVPPSSTLPRLSA
jgi:hypothetical protein